MQLGALGKLLGDDTSMGSKVPTLKIFMTGCLKHWPEQLNIPRFSEAMAYQMLAVVKFNWINHWKKKLAQFLYLSSMLKLSSKRLMMWGSKTSSFCFVFAHHRGQTVDKLPKKETNMHFVKWTSELRVRVGNNIGEHIYLSSSKQYNCHWHCILAHVFSLKFCLESIWNLIQLIWHSQDAFNEYVIGSTSPNSLETYQSYHCLGVTKSGTTGL